MFYNVYANVILPREAKRQYLNVFSIWLRMTNAKYMKG